MGRAVRVALLVSLAAGALLWATARADYLVADLSDRRISITTGFTGTKVLLFGATDGEGDVAVVVRGPTQPVVVRRKHRIGGVWINRAWMRFDGVPAFYRVASSRPLAELAGPALLSRHEIGIDHLRVPPAKGSPQEETGAFRDALVRNMERGGLYESDLGKVTFLGERLFRTTVDFPANVATGAYSVEVFLIREGEVANAQRWPLFINRSGVGAEIYEYAHRSSMRYGIIAVFCALMAGWLGAVVFRKV
jgi:uncharacterized protein (TIGR02186 family)